MSISQIESKIKSLQAEITRLNRQNAEEAKKEAKAQENIRRTQKSITKNTSLSSLKTKQRTIASETDKADKARKKQAEILEKIGKKKTELAKQQGLLQKEQDKAFKSSTDKHDSLIEAQRKLVSEDKEAVAKPLADALIAKGAKVWLDKYEMTVGDSLRQSIDDGLAHSRYGIVILSETYFKKFWTGKELNGLFAKQEDGQKVILPVWHNISKDKVKEYSPILADMFALKTADFTIDELAEEFIKLVQ